MLWLLLAVSNMNRKIYIDQDDVLADFSGGLGEFNIRNETDFIHLPKSEWTSLQKKLDRQVVDCMNTPGFFQGLPVKEGAKELWDTACGLGTVYVLTAWPKTTKDIPRIVTEKKNWIDWYMGDIGDRFICCPREDKSKYAFGRSRSPMMDDRPNILIDDLPDNIERWNAAGGIGILYKDVNQAINELKEIVKVV